LNPTGNQPISENTRIAKAAGAVSAATFLSRVFGFLRDAVIAWFFGAGPVADAFFVAFRIPNLLRRLFAEGALTVTFIPVFTDLLSRSGRKEALAMAGSAFRCLSVVLVLTAVAGVLLAPLLIRVIAPGFTGTENQFDLAVVLTRLMFPYIIFLGLTALSMGILNVFGHFSAPALAPVMLNLAMIGSVFLVSPRFDPPVIGLALGVVVGGCAQFGLQLPFLVRNGVRLFRRNGWYHPALGKIGRLMVPAVLGAAVHQVNILVGTLLASLLAEGSISYLYYAERLIQFPLGLFAVAMATAALPSLSRQAAGKDIEAFKHTFIHAVKIVWFIVVPAMVGLIVLRTPIVAALFMRGAFDAESAGLTASAVLYYGMGLWAFASVRIVVSTFYALKDTKTPFRTALVAIGANIVLGALLMVPMGHGGLALAASLASMVNLGLLVRALGRKIGDFDWRGMGRSAGMTVICSGSMGWVVHAAAVRFIPQGGDPLFGLAVCIVIGLGVYGLLSLLLKRPELDTVLSRWFKGGNR
jgi:putative peptidoglycan lipid II flippase